MKKGTKESHILYTYVQARSFVQTDLKRLADVFTVTPYYFPAWRKSVLPFLFIRQALYLILFGWKYSHFACFFAGYHSVLPSLFAKWTGKKCVLFLGGTDCFKYPSFHYGNFTRKFYGKATCISAGNASMLVPVSSNLIKTEATYYKEDSITQGIYHWCKNLTTPYTVVPTEYDPGLFFRRDIQRVENSFITIAFDIRGTSYMRKGIDKAIMIATHFPELPFTIVGCDPDDFPVKPPHNVTLIPPVPHARIPEYLSAHQFYLQLSIAEGLPNAVCEAMLCECIPIGSKVAAIPEIISSHGFIVEERKDEVILDTIRSAIAYDQKNEMGIKARHFIMTHYGPGTRLEALKKIFSI